MRPDWPYESRLDRPPHWPHTQPGRPSLSIASRRVRTRIKARHFSFMHQRHSRYARQDILVASGRSTQTLRDRRCSYLDCHRHWMRHIHLLDPSDLTSVRSFPNHPGIFSKRQQHFCINGLAFAWTLCLARQRSRHHPVLWTQQNRGPYPTNPGFTHESCPGHPGWMENPAHFPCPWIKRHGLSYKPYLLFLILNFPIPFCISFALCLFVNNYSTNNKFLYIVLILFNILVIFVIICRTRCRWRKRVHGAHIHKGRGVIITTARGRLYWSFPLIRLLFQ